ncbi:hypothetical protein FOXYSP1_11765 [Fusarium oxysporum f. sp. phaseoli]
MYISFLWTFRDVWLFFSPSSQSIGAYRDKKLISPLTLRGQFQAFNIGEDDKAACSE